MTLLGPLLAGAIAGFVLGFAGAGGTIVGIPLYLYAAGVSPTTPSVPMPLASPGSGSFC